MRVTVGSIQDFCSELRERSEDVQQRTVRVAIVREPEQREAVTFAVGFAATCVLNTSDGPCLLEYVTGTGSDGRSGEHGSSKAADMDRLLRETCDDLQLKVRPGKIELV